MWYRILALCGASLLTACGGGNAATEQALPTNGGPSALDTGLSALIAEHELTGDPTANRTLPSIDDPVAQLGKALFFSKSLGGDFDSACVTCHHPMLGGADALSLPIGVGAIEPDLLGPGRSHPSGLPNVPRNSPTVFNAGLWDAGLFWDLRVESFGAEENANGAVSSIRTPDVELGAVDTDAGANLVAAQARFPVTIPEEMRGAQFEAGNDNSTVRAHLAARVGGYGMGATELPRNEWLPAFQEAFGNGDAQSLITFDNIAFAIGEYQRSMTFVDTPWKAYVEGDLDALSDAQKRGATLFLTSAEDGGGGCIDCHAGDTFSDGAQRLVAFPQFGPGKGDALDDDFGRGRETGRVEDRYRFRTPSLLNIAVTAPYGHAGTYETLETVVEHYDDPEEVVEEFFDDGGACALPQFGSDAACATRYPNSAANSEAALLALEAARDAGTARFQPTDLDGDEQDDIVAFLNALTDPCVVSRDCLAPWIADNSNAGPDDQQLNARDANGNLL